MNHDEMIKVIEAHKKDWESVECSDEGESWWVAKELHLVLVAKHHRIIPPKPKMVKYYGWIDEDGYSRLVRHGQVVPCSTPISAANWTRAPWLDGEVEE